MGSVSFFQWCLADRVLRRFWCLADVSCLVSGDPSVPVFSTVVSTFRLMVFSGGFINGFLSFYGDSPMLVSGLGTLFVIAGPFTPSFNVFIGCGSP